MKTILLPDDFPLVDIIAMIREHGLAMRWIGNGVYQAIPDTKHKEQEEQTA